MLEALQTVLPAAGTKKLSAFLVIRGRSVTAFNGAQVLTCPLDTELEFAPKARAFLRAVKRCKGATVALWLNPEGDVMVHSDNHTETVECAPLESFPDPIPPGLWFDAPRPRKPAKPKATPPEPVWLSPDYLPGLAEAEAFNVPLFTSEELTAAVMAREPFILDAEVFKNYFLVAVCSVVSGKVFFYEKEFSEIWGCDIGYNSIDGDGCDEPRSRLEWVVKHALLVTFNGNFFDLPELALLFAGKTCAELKAAADKIISEQVKPWQVLKSAKVKKLSVDHIDLYEVCPLDGSLKLYAGRHHAPRMQSLPFPPDTVLSAPQISILRYYCVNDLTDTAFCWVNLREQIELRQTMSERYGQDLRSKSDAQIAEAVIRGELQRLTYGEASVPTVAPGTLYRYKKPAFISYQTPMMNEILAKVESWDFCVSETGYVEIPNNPETGKPWELCPKIGEASYTIGMGGLHSNETTACHKADSETVIVDRDVASYYPAIILNLELYPLHLGPSFLQVYRSLVQRRLEAKKAAKHAGECAKASKANGDAEAVTRWKIEEAHKKAEAETLKIVVNGTFGKTLSRWSVVYAPDMGMTITITGQLSLLMLIESLELAGFQVCSANTDGIVVKCPRARREEMNTIFKAWEQKTGFNTEETEYSAIYSRDVNNYIAVKTDGKTKTKGAYFNPWASPEFRYERFKKNPTGTIVVDAVTEFLTKGTPVAQTIRSARDVRKFVSIRTVKGGAVKDGVYLGKAVRWYYGRGETGCIVYAMSGNRVAETEGARPLMDLPDDHSLPADLDFERYERDAAAVLVEIGAVKF